MNSRELFEAIKTSGIEYDAHESDLYVRVTPESRAIIGQYVDAALVSTFESQPNGELWFDVPFAYIPWWDAQAERVQS